MMTDTLTISLAVLVPDRSERAFLLLRSDDGVIVDVQLEVGVDGLQRSTPSGRRHEVARFDHLDLELPRECCNVVQ